MANEKAAVIDKAISDITKKFGTGAVMKMGEKSHMQIETVPSGSLLLDEALGVGGYPKGRIVEVYGPESSGKTTVTLHAIAEVQKQGGVAAFIDAEHALDPVYAKAIGVDIDNLLVSQPDTGEQALEIANELINTGAVDIIVIDSVAALVPKAEIEGEMGDSHVGLQARLMSQALRKLSGTINKQKTVCIFINQLREKVGVIYGSPEVTPGGRALKFYSSVRLDVRKRDAIKNGTDVVGSVTEIKVVKNKVAPPFKSVRLEMTFGKGFSRTSELIDLAVDFDIVDKAGAWYAYNGDKLGQGKENAKAFLEANPEIMAEITDKVQTRLSRQHDVIDENGEVITTED